MGTLLTICPRTARAVDTGVETDKSTLARIPDFLARVRCPACRHEHMISRTNVWLCEQMGGTDFFSPAA